VLHVAQPGKWLKLVTGLGWLERAQPIWVELGPAPKKIKKNKIKIYVCINKKI